jgi:hypothetical protein
MPNPPEMFQTEKNVNSSTNRQNRSSNVKRKQLAVLTKPRRWKPGAVNVFFAWRGIKGPRLFCFRTILQTVIYDDGVQWVQP